MIAALEETKEHSDQQAMLLLLTLTERRKVGRHVRTYLPAIVVPSLAQTWLRGRRDEKMVGKARLRINVVLNKKAEICMMRLERVFITHSPKDESGRQGTRVFTYPSLTYMSLGAKSFTPKMNECIKGTKQTVFLAKRANGSREI